MKKKWGCGPSCRKVNKLFHALDPGALTDCKARARGGGGAHMPRFWKEKKELCLARLPWLSMPPALDPGALTEGARTGCARMENGLTQLPGT